MSAGRGSGWMMRLLGLLRRYWRWLATGGALAMISGLAAVGLWRWPGISSLRWRWPALPG